MGEKSRGSPKMIPTTRRATLLAGLALPFARAAAAQPGPIRIGALTPQTGAGGSYGPPMVKVARAIVAEINAAGGVGGRMIELISEDDETNPDTGVRAARKLIDVDKVCAIIGTWASAVTTAVAPLCWESQVMLFTVSGGDGITKLPHKGYIIRTQPDSNLQSQRFGQFVVGRGAKKVFFLAAQTPFAESIYAAMGAELKQHGAEAIGQIIYDASKTTFRTEIGRALKANPDTIYLNSYAPDVTVLLRELYQAGFDGKKYTLAYAANAKVVGSLPPDVTEGLVTMAPSPDIDSPAYKKVQSIIGPDPDPYSCQVHDHVSLVALSIGKAGAATGPAIHDAVRAVGYPAGVKVSSAIEGLKLLVAGKEVNYEGASGPCKFTDIGNIQGCKFRFEVIEKGQPRLLTVS
jgi:branched-chain amino acid transport system substrate-binding protein